jgi:hypothetical protein
MIHVATVHWQSDRWIDLQLRYLERYLGQEFRMYAFLNEIEADHSGKFFYSSTDPIRDHATKLNVLADMIGFAAPSDDDLMLFIDGDAFPVAPLAPLIDEHLAERKLIAVQRYENHGDLQPHPCFCITTVGFWKRIGGDWLRGHEWLDLDGHPVTDVGGNLLAAVERDGVDWLPLRRVNRRNPHPLFFAVYGTEDGEGIVYHHGAGFREAPGGRVSRMSAGEREIWNKRRTRFFDRLPRHGVLGWIRRRFHPVKRLRRGLKEETVELSEEYMARIEADDDFWKELLQPAASTPELERTPEPAG